MFVEWGHDLSILGGRRDGENRHRAGSARVWPGRMIWSASIAAIYVGEIDSSSSEAY